MTPKEKAFELTHKFRLIDFRTSESTTMMISMSDAKQCALIAVDEILASNPLEPSIEDTSWFELEVVYSESNKQAIAYWQEVKQEIEKL